MLPTVRFDLIKSALKLVASVPQTCGTVSKNCLADRGDVQSRMVPACKARGKTINHLRNRNCLIYRLLASRLYHKTVISE